MHSTCPDQTTRAACRYVSPSLRPLTPDEARIRALAYAVKDCDCDPELIEAAAREMAALIENESGYLIPVPDHEGATGANHNLAKAIAHLTGSRFAVSDALTRSTAESSQCSRHRRRETPLPPDRINIMRRSGDAANGIRLTGAEKIYFVDNVITSGNTIEACRRVFFGLGTGLVYADAHYDAKD